MQMNKKEGKIRFKLYGENRIKEALTIIKDKSPHLINQFESILNNKSITQAEIYLCESAV